MGVLADLALPDNVGGRSADLDLRETHCVTVEAVAWTIPILRS